MPLKIVFSAKDQLLAPQLLTALREGLKQTGHVVLLTETHDQALLTQRALAEQPSLGLGVTTTTPDAWVDERWEVWGDGRRVVSAAERMALMRLALKAAPATILPTAGTLDELCRVAQAALPQALGACSAAVGTRLSPGEEAACEVLRAYAALLTEHSLVERAEACRLLCRAMPHHDAVVAAGVVSPSAPLRGLLVSLAKDVQVSVVVGASAGPLRELPLLGVLADEARLQAVEVALEHHAAGQPAPDARLTGETGEVAQLHACLLAAEAHAPLCPTGAVRLLESAGPLAQWEAVAQELQRLAEGGARQMAVVVPDVAQAWRGLAPKLAAHGLYCRATPAQPAPANEALRAFMGFARLVARLAELAQTWPAPAHGPEGAVPQLGDMSWWPPRPLTDFLLSAVAQVDAEKAWALDARWRGNRMLSPQQVLDQLQKESLTSRAVAQATASVLKGRVGSAAQLLARSYADCVVPAEPEAPGAAFSRQATSQEDAQVLASLACVQSAARTVASLGVRAQAPGGAGEPMALSQLVDLVFELVERTSLSAHLALGDEGPEPLAVVRLCSRAQAARIEAESLDALVICGLTSAEWPLAPNDDAATALTRALGIQDDEPPLLVARRRLRGMVSALRPAGVLVLERSMHDHDAQPTYPAVMLSELVGCYGADAALLPRTGLGETDVSQLLSSYGTFPEVAHRLPNVPAGVVGPAAQDMVVVPREGEANLAGGVPSLSASQIESYLECPYKWFALRRLGLDDCDAQFSPLEMGSFAHRVLEVSHRMLAQRAAEEAGLLAPGAPLDLSSLDATFIPGASVSMDNLPLARSLVTTEFDYHLMHQRQRATMRSAQSLVPHSATQEWRLELLRRDLLSVLDFEATRLVGFSPRYFELRFGGSGASAHHVRYAGVDFLGSIDRVDVDAHGRAVVIDYKHKGALGFAAEYDAFVAGSPATTGELVLPRRVQSLIYAQVVRRIFPQLKVVGAVYLSTLGGPHGTHEIAGVIDASAADQVMGKALTDRRWERLVAGGMGKVSFEEYLDETERLIAEKVSLLTQGSIEARPLDERACAWCPVTNCERRLA